MTRRRERKGLWAFGMTRQEVRDFLWEYFDSFIEVFLTAYGMTADEIVVCHMGEEAEEYLRAEEEEQ